MKRIYLICLLTIILLCAYSCNDHTAGEEFTIMSYNIRNCRGMDEVTDFPRLVEVIRTVSPDVVALQELDSATVRLDGRYVLGELAAMTGMYPTYGPAIDYQGGKYGVGVLSHEKPLNHRSIPLPGREEQRTLLMVEFNDYVLFCTHLSLNEEDRMASYDIITKEAQGYSKPVILAGDFNANADSELIEKFSAAYTILSDKALGTIPAGNPDRCIDYIMYYGPSENVRIVHNGVDQQTIASDHSPVWARIRF